MVKIFPFLVWMRELTPATFRDDLFAGLTGAVIVLPQGVAFAIIAGLPPVYGLYTAMVLPIVAGLFGSSKHLISGPTTAISIVVFASVRQFAPPGSPDYIQIAISLTLLAGIVQLIFGLARLGMIVNFVSHSVVIGFTAGAALLIATSQLPYFFGIEIARELTFIESMWELLTRLPEVSLPVMSVSIATLLVAFVLKKIHPLIPGMLMAMVAGSLIYLLYAKDTAIPVVGAIPGSLPPFQLPRLGFTLFQKLAPSALAVALLGLIEAVAIARSIASKTNQTVDSSQEFIGQGLSNIVGSFYSCYAGSGSFTRSGLNFTAGGKTPLSGIFAAIFLMMIVLWVAPLTRYLPMAAMSGVILLVAFNLIDVDHIRKILKSSKRESTVLIITFVSTLVLDLEYAIFLGVIFSLIFYLHQTSRPRVVVLAPDPNHPYRRFLNIQKNDLVECPQLQVIRIEGSLFFGAVDHVKVVFDQLKEKDDRHLLIVSNNINLVDTSGAELLYDQVLQWNQVGRRIYFSGFKLRARNSLKNGGYWNQIGEERFFEHKEEAIEAIYDQLSAEKCAVCTAKIFKECHIRLPNKKKEL